MNAATAGQAAYAVMWAAAGVDVRWEGLDAGDQQLWDTIAQAVLDARVAEWTHDPLMDIPPGELVHLLGVVDLDSGGEAAYDGYRSASAARSLVSGQPLPQWAGQSEQIRGAWQAAAEGVVALLADKLTEAAAAQDARPAPVVTVEALAAALTGRRIKVTVGNGYETRKPADPHDLAVQLLSAIDSHLAGDAGPAPEPHPASMPGPAGFNGEPELTGHPSIRFPVAVIAAAKQLAAAEGMTVSAWIRREVERESARREQPGPELAGAVDALTKVAESHERVMYAAAIDIRLGDPGAAKRLLGEQLDGWDGPEWNGTDTGAQYLERAREGESS